MLASVASMIRYPDAPIGAESSLAGRTILQIVPDLNSGGAERTTLEIAEALAGVGARSLVAAQGGRMVSELQAKGGVWLPFPAGSKNPLQMMVNSVRLARILRDEGVDILHARSRASAWVAYFAARRAGVKFVTTYHGAYSGVSAMKLRYNAIMAAGQAVIANSTFTAQRILDLDPAVADRLFVIPRGVDLRQFSPTAIDPARVERLRREWGVLPHERIVLMPARLSARKGLGVVVEAVKLLAAQGAAQDCIVILAGDPHSESFRKTAESQIVRAGAERFMRIVGYCDDMPAAYLAAAAVMAPATVPEAFGRIGVEAQAMGAPVIVTNIGAAAEIVLAPPETPAQLATGWRVPAGDPAALAAAIREALNLQASARDALSLRAREHVRRRFSIEEMQRATLDVYRRLLHAP
jgi:glycosyltransferase involved in cell wall biosynthesis